MAEMPQLATSTSLAQSQSGAPVNILDELPEELSWTIAFCFGALVVAIYSWSRFDEPSYSKVSGYFRRYQPRFATSRAQYRKAKLGYMTSVVGLYGMLSIFPQLILLLLLGPDGDKILERFEASSVPLYVATFLIGLHNLPGVRELEGQIRSALHAFGKIPEGVRRSVSQLRSAKFDFERYRTQTGVVNDVLQGTAVPLDTPNLAQIIEDDNILRPWVKVHCLLYHLSEPTRHNTGISSSFFEIYGDELDSIKAQIHALGPLVRSYMTQKGTEKEFTDEASFGGLSNLQNQLYAIRDRLYTFIACGLRSSKAADEQILEELGDLGFQLDAQPIHTPAVALKPIFGIFVLAVIVLSTFTTFATLEFLKHIVDPLGLPPDVRASIPIPTSTFLIYAWSPFTAAFYLFSILGALFVRSLAISKRNWFNLHTKRRTRPVIHYTGAIFIGGCCGYATLFIITFGILLFSNDQGMRIHMLLASALQSSAYWVPLALIISFAALWLSDSKLMASSTRGIIIRASVTGLGMAFVGFLISHIVSNAATDTVDISKLPNRDEFAQAMLQANLLISAFIFIFSTILAVLIQFVEQDQQDQRNLGGNWFLLRSSDGKEYRLSLGVDHKASVQNEGGEQPYAPKVVAVGEWAYFPEGNVIKWSSDRLEPANDEFRPGSFGILSRDQGLIIYEEFRSRVNGKCDYVAQVENYDAIR